MRHKVEGRTLGREKGHRQALIRNLVIALVKHDRIETTHTRALEARKVAERLITYGKKGTLHSQRLIYDVVRDRDLVKKVMDEIVPQLNDRNGGYTRVLKKGFRKGDGAPVSIMEWVYHIQPEPEKKDKDS
ncbi:MAG: 50S ribosomal protein L17 [Candidatus Cloacimonas sp.]|nr:50S ribosomal protein L17 [Candidatus Cloacimonadota bacterium]